MINRSELVVLLSSEGFSAYETERCFDVDLDIRLKTQHISELINIAKENNVKSVFFSFEYADADEYFIYQDDILDEEDYLDETEAYFSYKSYFQAESLVWNEQLSHIDFTEPVALYIYCIVSGIEVGIVQENPWTDNLQPKYLKLTELQTFLENAIDEISVSHQESEKAKLELALQEIFNHLETTSEWHIYTNQQLRRRYCHKLAQEYSEQHNVRIHPYLIEQELELKWREYKATKK